MSTTVATPAETPATDQPEDRLRDALGFEEAVLEADLSGFSPALNPDSFERNQELRIVGWQYASADGDLPARTPYLEVLTRTPGETCARTGLMLTLEDVPKLIDSLNAAAASLRAAVRAASAKLAEPSM